MSMRARHAWVVVALAACGPRPAPRTAAAASPAGPRLRLSAKPGEETRGRASLSVDVDLGAGQAVKWGGQRIALALRLVTVEKVEAVDPDGTAHLKARLDEVAGAAGQSGDESKVGAFAAALSQVTVGFSRGPRGEVGPLELGELPPPLTEPLVRAILNAVFAAQRGAVLPAGPSAPGNGWTERIPLPPGGGFEGQATYQYQHVSDDAERSRIACDVVIAGVGGGQGTPRRLAVRSTDEYQLDRARARFVATRIDTQLEVEQTLRSTTTQVRQHVRAEWARAEEGP